MVLRVVRCHVQTLEVLRLFRGQNVKMQSQVDAIDQAFWRRVPHVGQHFPKALVCRHLRRHDLPSLPDV